MKNTMDPRLLAARHALGLLRPVQLCDVARAWLAAGLYSPALARLGAARDLDPGEVAGLFVDALEERGIPVPRQRDAVLRVADHYAEQMLDEFTDRLELTRKLIRDAYARWDEDRDRSLDAFVYWEREWSFARDAERRAECEAAIRETAALFLDRRRRGVIA